VTQDKSGAVSAFVGFSDDCGLFAFLVVTLFVVFILVIHRRVGLSAAGPA
jgi:hypothetical protein